MPIEFKLIEKDGSATNRATASWERGEGGFTASFEVRHRLDQGDFTKFSTTNKSLTVDGVKPGTRFQVQVRAVGTGFPVKKSAYAVAEAIAPALPSAGQVMPNVTDLSITPINDTAATLHWKAPINQKLNNITAIIKHSSKTDGTGTFADSVKLAEVPAGQNIAVVPLLNGEYLIKLRDDTTKVKSDSAISIVINIPDASSKVLVSTRRAELDVGLLMLTQDDNFLITQSGDNLAAKRLGVFFGNKTNVSYNESYNGLILNAQANGDRFPSGEYEFGFLEDLGGKFAVSLERILNSVGLYFSDFIDDRSALIDTWTDFDGSQPEDTSAVLYFRASDDAPTTGNVLLESSPDFFLLEDGDKLLQESSTVFGEWSVLDKAVFVGRTFQFKAELQTDHPDQTPLVRELGYSLSIPSRVESSAIIASGAAAKVVTFTNAFYQAPTVGITAFNFASGDYYEVTSVSRTGFTVHFKDSSNSSIDRNFQYAATGFGSEQT